jgi:pimeloyl-ACP methyl ester carboxylesterase
MDKSEMVALASGRRVALHRLAEGNGQRTVVFCHPAPGAGNFDPDPAETPRRPVTLIAPDRPGYGQSDPLPADQWATVSQSADDLAELLRQIGGGPVGLAGWSAGGRVALALAARHPELVDRVVVLSTPAPDEEVPWIPPELKQGIEALRGRPPAEVHNAFAAQFAELVTEDVSDEALLSLLAYTPADDVALGRPGARARVLLMLRAAFAQGVTGLAADVAGYTMAPWGFEPAAVQAKTLCLYGDADPVAGSRHGAWWQKALPNARLEMVPGAGHMLVISMWRRALSHLAPGLR